MEQKINKIGVFTSGGDAPGMNACIRAVTRTAIYHDLSVVGICEGYKGMIEGLFEPLESSSVSNIVQRGGTILKSSRSQAFRTKEGRQKAYAQVKKAGIDALMAIGGDGTFKGAELFEQEFGISCIGIPGTIDNDLYGTDFTVGYDTAVNTAVEAVDKIRDTAASHHRLFFIEVMGRDTGFIALRSGIAGGAEFILVPETSSDVDELIKNLEEGWERQKSSMIVVVAEGNKIGHVFEVSRIVQERFQHYETRELVLGHLQRGGNPTCMDRVLASQLGAGAVEGLLEGKHNCMVGKKHRSVQYVPFHKAVKHHKDVDTELLRLSRILAT